jgi:hypothetical protein
LSEPKSSLVIGRRIGVVVTGLAVLLGAGLLTSKGTVSPSSPETQLPSAIRYPVDVRNGRIQLESALDVAQTYFDVHGTYEGFDATKGAELGPSLRWTGAVPATYGLVSIDFAKGPTVILSTRAASGTYLCRARGPQEDSAGLEDALNATQSTGCAGANP